MASELTEERMRRRLQASPLFDAADYVAANPDLAQVEPLDHVARHGLWERRPLIRSERRWARVAELCAGLAAPDPIAPSLARHALRHASALRVRLELRPDAPPRSRAAAQGLAAALAQIGAQVEGAPGAPASDGDRINVVVDPDPATDRAGGALDARDRYASAAVLLSGTPGDAAFVDQWPRALSGGIAFALAPETYAVLAASGVPTLWLELPPATRAAPGPPAAWRAVTPADAPGRWTDRPIEVAAFGLLTERRISSWLDMAERLARRRSFVHMSRPRASLPVRDDDDLRRAVLARAQVAVHLHAAEPTALDWRDVCAAALGQGAVVVAEPGLAHPRFDPDLHYFEEPPRRIPALVDWLLDAPDGRREAQRRRLAARSALAQADDLFDAGVRAAAFLLAHRAAIG